ncbi:MAG: tryptophan--tRNA ligase [Chitinivibrionia bacterium]|nr:tryptophan--tRNA ligase [Chitinivibrionia bacterium]
MDKKISLTGIKPTGIPHLGNYFGAIKPALQLAQKYEARYFIADYHALNTIKNPRELRDLTYEVAAAWLSCGLDPEKVLFYRQSDVPETFELSVILTAFTSKGLMNRSHAYKSVVDANKEKGADPDHNINMGLFTYPILMAADILLFDSDFVPVGRDQKQHVEIAADIAQTINSNYKKQLFTIPEGVYDGVNETVLGLDGRKMSKSYDNTIPLFIPEKQLRKILMKIVTNSQEVSEAKVPETCNVFAIYKLFASQEQQNALAAKYRSGGMGWGEAKQELFETMNAVIKPMRDIYDDLMADKSKIDKILALGAQKAREISSKKIAFLRREIGI